jgi:hypothetical protein
MILAASRFRVHIAGPREDAMTIRTALAKKTGRLAAGDDLAAIRD